MNFWASLIVFTWLSNNHYAASTTSTWSIQRSYNMDYIRNVPIGLDCEDHVDGSIILNDDSGGMCACPNSRVFHVDEDGLAGCYNEDNLCGISTSATDPYSTCHLGYGLLAYRNFSDDVPRKVLRIGTDLQLADCGESGSVNGTTEEWARNRWQIVDQDRHYVIRNFEKYSELQISEVPIEAGLIRLRFGCTTSPQVNTMYIKLLQNATYIHQPPNNFPKPTSSTTQPITETTLPRTSDESVSTTITSMLLVTTAQTTAETTEMATSFHTHSPPTTTTTTEMYAPPESQTTENQKSSSSTEQTTNPGVPLTSVNPFKKTTDSTRPDNMFTKDGVSSAETDGDDMLLASSEKKEANIPVVVLIGVASGAIVFVILIVALGITCRKRHRKALAEMTSAVSQENNVHHDNEYASPESMNIGKHGNFQDKYHEIDPEMYTELEISENTQEDVYQELDHQQIAKSLQGGGGNGQIYFETESEYHDPSTMSEPFYFQTDFDYPVSVSDKVDHKSVKDTEPGGDEIYEVYENNKTVTEAAPYSYAYMDAASRITYNEDSFHFENDFNNFTIV